MSGASAWGAVAQGVSNVAGGLIANAGASRRQRKAFQQQKQLMDIQQMNQRELNQQGFDLQKRMWDETNYGAQMEHLKNAGLNPAIMYGMSGGGGVTTGSQGGGSAASGSAPAYSQPQSMDISNALMMSAQIKLLEAQAKKAEAEADSTRGVEGTKGAAEIGKINTEISSLTQGIANQKAQEGLVKAQTEMQNIDNMVKEATTNNVIDEIISRSEKTAAEARQAMVQADVDEATIENKIDTIRANTVGATLQNTLTRMQIKLTSEESRKIGAEIYNIYRQINLRKFSNETDRMNAITNELRQIVDKDLGYENLSMREKEFLVKTLEGAFKGWKSLKSKQTSTTWTKQDGKGTTSGHTETKSY